MSEFDHRDGVSRQAWWHAVIALRLVMAVGAPLMGGFVSK
jgi:hypothetical protein